MWEAGGFEKQFKHDFVQYIQHTEPKESLLSMKIQCTAHMSTRG